MPEHTFFLFFYDYEWEAIGAMATAAAAIVALALPFIMRGLDRRAETDRLRMRYHEVAAATLSAVECLNGTLNDFNSWRKAGGSLDLRRAAARARSRAGTLKILANQSGLTDGAIASCVGAAAMMQEIMEADESTRSGDNANVSGHLDAALALARETTTRIAGVIRYHEIELKRAEWPQLPRSIFD